MRDHHDGDGCYNSSNKAPDPIHSAFGSLTSFFILLPFYHTRKFDVQKKIHGHKSGAAKSLIIGILRLVLPFAAI
jgi:hypothetical protein